MMSEPVRIVASSVSCPPRRFVAIVMVTLWAWALPQSAQAQSGPSRFEAAVQIASVYLAEFDDTDLGIGGRFGWKPVALISLESEITVYPGGFPDPHAFSARRMEGLFGATVGPALGRWRPFARMRTGFLRVQEAPGPYACILIHPPPLSCTLAAGQTLAVFDVGGGAEVFVTRRTFFRVDAGGRLVKYPGPAFMPTGRVTEDGFFGYDFRFAASGGLRF